MSADRDTWTGELGAANAAAHDATHDAATPVERLAGARRFVEIARRFATGGAPALDALEQVAAGRDPARAEVALRVYAALEDPATVARFLTFWGDATRGGHFLADHHLRLVGLRTALPDDVLDLLQGSDAVELVAARFRRPSPEARARFAAALAEQDDHTLFAAMPAVARWPAPDLLRAALDAPPPDLSNPPPSPIEGMPYALAPRDLRPEAAFHLALLGEPGAVDKLVELAAEPAPPVAGAAVKRLAQLAHPDGIAATARVLRARANTAVELAVDAVGAYRAAALADATLDLVLRRAKAKNALPDDAITVLVTRLVDVPLGDEVTSFLGTPGHRVGEADRRAAVAAIRKATSRLDPGRRYALGVPLTLAHLADELLSRHDGERANAAAQLRAITGEDHGYDSDADVLANVEAIDAWRARAANPAPLEPGGWAFLGAPLPPPAVP